MTIVHILNETGETVAFADRLSYSQKMTPWVDLTNITLTDTGKHLYGNSLRLAGTAFDMLCGDGLCFVGCKAEGFRGPDAPIRFLVLDVLDKDDDTTPRIE